MYMYIHVRHVQYRLRGTYMRASNTSDFTHEFECVKLENYNRWHGLCLGEVLLLIGFARLHECVVYVIVVSWFLQCMG